MNTIERSQRLYLQMKERNERVHAAVEQVLEIALHTPDCDRRPDWPQIQRTLELFLTSQLHSDPTDCHSSPTNSHALPHANRASSTQPAPGK